MNREQLMLMRPTAQVRVLAEEFLRDGKIHSRREIVEYVKEQGKKWHLPVFREGHIAGGIREAVTNLDCEKIERGTFRMPVAERSGPTGEKTEESELPELSDDIPTIVSCSLRAEEVCNDAKKRLTEISREIDYVSANEAELGLLLRIREYVKFLEKFGKSADSNGDDYE